MWFIISVWSCRVFTAFHIVANQWPTKDNDCLWLPLLNIFLRVRTGKGHCTAPVTYVERKSCNDFVNKIIYLNLETFALIHSPFFLYYEIFQRIFYNHGSLTVHKLYALSGILHTWNRLILINLLSNFM